MIGHQISDQLQSVGEVELGVSSQNFEQTWIVSVHIVVFFGSGGHFDVQEPGGKERGARKSGYEPNIEMFAFNTIIWSAQKG